VSDQWRANGKELYFGDQASDFVGLHTEALAPVIADRHNAMIAEQGLLGEIAAELARARTGHAPLNSAHEAYAVILEELDEFKAEVWKKTRERDWAAMRAELIQLAAMAIRTIEDLKL
jgi:hypothetical protein